MAITPQRKHSVPSGTIPSTPSETMAGLIGPDVRAAIKETLIALKWTIALGTKGSSTDSYR
jgi:hypothetical protein